MYAVVSTENGEVATVDVFATNMKARNYVREWVDEDGDLKNTDGKQEFVGPSGIVVRIIPAFDHTR